MMLLFKREWGSQNRRCFGHHVLRTFRVKARDVNKATGYKTKAKTKAKAFKAKAKATALNAKANAEAKVKTKCIAYFLKMFLKL